MGIGVGDEFGWIEELDGWIFVFRVFSRVFWGGVVVISGGWVFVEGVGGFGRIVLSLGVR